MCFFRQKKCYLCAPNQKNMSKLHSIIDLIRNHKNLVVILIWALFVGYIDSNSIWDRHFLWQSISGLKKEIASLEASYQENTRKLNELQTNPHAVERVAREKYYMTRPDEDLFIIQSDFTQPEGEVVTASAPTDEEPAV